MRPPLAKPAFVFAFALALLSACGEKDEPAPPAKTASPPPPVSRAACDADLARLMTGFGTAVRGIHDQPSWDRAKLQIDAILAEILQVTARLRQLPAPTPEDFATYFPRTQARENALQEALGDRDAFLARLPPEVAAELLDLGGQFHTVMGVAQLSLRSNSRPRGSFPTGISSVPIL